MGADDARALAFGGVPTREFGTNVEAGRGAAPAPGCTRAVEGGRGAMAGAVAMTGAEFASDDGTATRFAETGRRLAIAVAGTAVIAPGTPTCV